MKRVLSLILAVVIGTFSTIGSLGLSIVGAEESNEYMTWLQTDSRWKNHSYFGDTIGRIGCFYTCCCIMCAAANPEFRDPEYFNPGTAQELDVITSTGGWGSNSPIEYITYSHFAKGTDIDEINQTIKKHIEEDGYYVVLRCVNKNWGSWEDPYEDTVKIDGKNYYPMHYVVVLGIADDGYPIVWDVYEGCDTYPKENDGTGVRAHPSDGGDDLLGYIVDARCYKAKSGYLKASEGLQGVTTEMITEASNNVFKNGYHVLSDDLIGMPAMGGIMKEQAQLFLPDGSKLSSSDKNAIGIIKDNENSDNVTVASVMRKVFVFVGVLVMIYAVLLVLSYFFDRMNVFFDFSLVSFLTFGTVKVLTALESREAVPKGYTSNKAFFIRVGVIFAAGILLVSGVILRLIETVIGMIMG